MIVDTECDRILAELMYVSYSTNRALMTAAQAVKLFAGQMDVAEMERRYLQEVARHD